MSKTYKDMKEDYDFEDEDVENKKSTKLKKREQARWDKQKNQES